MKNERMVNLIHGHHMPDSRGTDPHPAMHTTSMLVWVHLAHPGPTPRRMCHTQPLENRVLHDYSLVLQCVFNGLAVLYMFLCHESRFWVMQAYMKGAEYVEFCISIIVLAGDRNTLSWHEEDRKHEYLISSKIRQVDFWEMWNFFHSLDLFDKSNVMQIWSKSSTGRVKRHY